MADLPQLSSVTMQQEYLSAELFEEAEALTTAHWQECGCWTDKIKLSVDTKRYLVMETYGNVACYTMRNSGVLTGYMVILLGPHLHYKDDLWAQVDVLFVDKKCREGLSAVRFMKYVEAEIKARGVAAMAYHIKSFHDYPAIFERLGFDKIEIIYAKCLKE